MSVFSRKRSGRVVIDTARLLLRPPRIEDFEAWAKLRRESRKFLVPWEPAWAADHLSSRAFRNRITWVERNLESGDALPLFLETRGDGQLIGGITLSNIRRQPAMAATVGYWVGEPFARNGYMTEALTALREHAFNVLDLSRLEAGCLPENAASRRLLERCMFKYEGVAQAYLQIDGRWRNHVLYAALRADRRGRVED